MLDLRTGITGSLAAALALGGAESSASRGLGPQAARTAPDHVFVLDAPDGAVAPLAGRVTKNEVGRVVLEGDKGRRELDPRDVWRIAWSDAPAEFRAARLCFARGDAIEAAAKFRIAARTPGTRELVVAAARLGAAEALLRAGEHEPAYLLDAAREAHELIAAHPLDAAVPRARELEARATLLAGKPAEAIVLYRALWSQFEAGGEFARYEPELCARAGLMAARALVEARDAAGASRLFGELDERVSAAIARRGADDPVRARLQAVRDETSLAPGFAALASGEASEALAFFDGAREANAGQPSPARRSCTDLGRGRALLELGRTREASLALARVCALETHDRDRAALAAVLLAECYMRLPDADGKAQACLRLRSVIHDYGDAPAVRRARALAQELGC